MGSVFPSPLGLSSSLSSYLQELWVCACLCVRASMCMLWVGVVSIPSKGWIKSLQSLVISNQKLFDQNTAVVITQLLSILYMWTHMQASTSQWKHAHQGVSVHHIYIYMKITSKRLMSRLKCLLFVICIFSPHSRHCLSLVMALFVLKRIFPACCCRIAGLSFTLSFSGAPPYYKKIVNVNCHVD